jgi:DNA-binding GntR family transcriptional regulator
MQAGDVSIRETWKRRDWEFHQALIQACDSKNLLALHSIIFDKYLRYQMLVLTFRGDEAAIEHKAILDAALSRDSATAQNILETHILAGLRHALMAF